MGGIQITSGGINRNNGGKKRDRSEKKDDSRRNSTEIEPDRTKSIAQTNFKSLFQYMLKTVLNL